MEFPADMLLLYAEDHDGHPLDFIFVDTVNLDGENYLKKRDIVDSSVQSIEDLNTYHGYLEYDFANKDLENWHGLLTP